MFLKNNNKIILLILLTVFFSFLIFITKNYFFGGFNNYENKIIEENYIEPQNNINKEKLDKIIEEKLDKKLNSASKIKYTFFPSSFSSDSKVKNYKSIINDFFNSNHIISKLSFLEIYIHKNISEVRGKMKDKKVKLFGILNMNKQEFLAVGIHEFAHFIDLYYFEKKINYDISDYFYNISWETTKVLKSGQKQKDFVSGYAMTNKYEDFAESFVYYILHNSDFLEKSKKSNILKEKYNFFSKYLFREKEFITKEYKNTKKVKDYYRDITKIEFSLENFLQYLKK